MATVSRFPITLTTDSTLTSNFAMPGQWRFTALEVPPTSDWCITATCAIFVRAAGAADGTYYEGSIVNPAGVGTGGLPWKAGLSNTVSGSVMECPPLQYAEHFKIETTNTSTAAAMFYAIGTPG